MTSLRARYGSSGSSTPHGREGRVATVVDEHHVGRRAGREVGPQSRSIVALAGDVDELDVDVRMAYLEGGHQDW